MTKAQFEQCHVRDTLKDVLMTSKEVAGALAGLDSLAEQAAMAQRLLQRW
jgi:hypothetical protein